MSIQQTTQESALRCSEKGAVKDEQALVLQAKSGHSGAFGELYERYRLQIYRSAFRILRNRQDAEDAVQRSFQRAFMNLSRFRGDSAFCTWVTRIAVNEALMLLRQRRATTSISQSNDIEDLWVRSVVDIADGRPTPEQTLARDELRSLVIQTISGLRDSLRSVALLRELQGLTSAETARRLGLSVSAVKARTFHARRYLRQELKRRYKVGRDVLIGT